MESETLSVSCRRCRCRAWIFLCGTLFVYKKTYIFGAQMCRLRFYMFFCVAFPPHPPPV